MQGIREYNRKITSLRNTRKITSSMKMISSVKLQRFTKTRTSVMPFWDEARKMHARLSPLVARRDSRAKSQEAGPARALVVFVTSDRGMCGQHNNNAIREAMTLYDTLRDRSMEVRFGVAGGRGVAFLNRHRVPIAHEYPGAASRASYDDAVAIADDCFGAFERHEADEVWLVYTLRVSSLDQRPTAERLLPLAPAGTERAEIPALLEEPGEALLETAEPLIARARIHRALVESAVSEHEARMAAMDAATSNCERLIQRYVQLRNRARQAAITTELSEIVTGKEALEQ